tara:strand:+ start:278 stop:706 length:429 start_codon:yes stop_codon:yes gene_type:complete
MAKKDKSTDPTQASQTIPGYDKVLAKKNLALLKKKSTDETIMEGTFGEAFALARKAGKKTFTWGGKSYHTKTKEDVTEQKRSAARKKTGLPDWSNEAEVKQYYKDNPTKRGGYNPESTIKQLKKRFQKRDGGFLEPGIESLD